MNYQLRRSKRARALSITVYPDGAVTVTAPYVFGLRAIERFLAKHSAWVERKVEEAKGRSVIRVPRADIPRLKRRAEEIAHEKCARFASALGVTYGTITIRAQRSRWGSCSHSGNLSFNYKIAALPEHLADYIIVHELCHRIHFDHSRAFWGSLERLIPEHRRLRRELSDIVFLHR